MVLNNNQSVNSEVLSVLSKFGCLTYSQIYYFLKPPKTVNEEAKVKKIQSIEKIINYIKDGSVGHNQYAGWTSEMQYSQEMIDCIWAMIDMMKSGNDSNQMYDKLQNSFKLEKPESISFIKDNRIIVRAMAVENELNLPAISFVQDKIYNMYGATKGEEEKIFCTLLIVIRDKSYIGKISQIGLTIPHKIALLNGGLLEEPTVKYFGSRLK